MGALGCRSVCWLSVCGSCTGGLGQGFRVWFRFAGAGDMGVHGQIRFTGCKVVATSQGEFEVQRLGVERLRFRSLRGLQVETSGCTVQSLGVRRFGFTGRLSLRHTEAVQMCLIIDYGLQAVRLPVSVLRVCVHEITIYRESTV